MDSLAEVEQWPVSHAAAAVIDPAGTVHTSGDPDRRFALASVTKLLTAVAVHIAHDEGTVDVGAPAGPPGATLGDLLAHCSGITPEGGPPLWSPGSRRAYTNVAYEVAADQVAAGAGFEFADYLHEAVFEPLAMSATRLAGSAAAGGVGTVADLVRFVDAIRSGRLLSEPAHRRFTTAHCPDAAGILPGFGRQTPNPWAQGPELRGRKDPHWCPTSVSVDTWGHFGRSGTFLWHDPNRRLSLIVLTDEPFGPWARAHWPVLGAAVVDQFDRSG